MAKLEKSTIILTTIITAATVLVAAALISFTHGNKARIKKQNAEYLVDASRQMAANIDAAISDGYDNIRIVANLLSHNRTTAQFDVNQLRTLMEESVFDFMEFADTDGMDHTVTGAKTYAGDRKYYTEGVLEGKTGMELIYNSRATHETLLMFYSPVYFKTEIIGAVIGVYQAADKITKLLTVDYFGEPATSYLATAEGRIIASSGEYDPSVEKYISELMPGGCIAPLEESGWSLVQYFPEKATQNMVRKANRLGYRLMGFVFLMFAIALISALVYLRKRHNKHQAQLRAAMAKAESANRAKTTFLSNMSHDIRTPLNAITGFNNMALRKLGKDEDMVRECLEKVNRSSDALLTIINDILEISRIEAGKVTISQDEGDVMNSFVNIQPMMEEVARTADIKLNFSFGEVKDRYVLCDISHMCRVFTNLISNAIKFNEKGGWVNVRCEQTGRNGEYGEYVYTVEDNGIGMSEAFQKDLFQQFSREKTSTVSRIQGTGLGLALSKNLIESMGGTITCESYRGEGSKFIVTVPFKIREGVAPEAGDAVPADIAGAFKGRKVLLVEDNAMNLEIATAILEEMGIVVTTATDGAIATEKMSAAKPGDFDIVLMDIQMPVVDGYEATRQIRALGTEISQIPIIAMTANAFAEDRQQALAAGMNAHLTKPINLDELKATLAKFLK